MTAICVPVFVNGSVDVEEVLAEAQELLGAGDDSTPAGERGMIELRCDTASLKQMSLALEALRLPAIVTVRPAWEGGFSHKTDHERIALWEAAMEAGAEYVDVELMSWENSLAIREVLGELAAKHGTRVIVSNHSFGGRPGDLPQRLARLRAVAPASILKIAWTARSVLDAIEALRLCRDVAAQDGRPVIALAMGEEGVISRLLAKKFGAQFTFASAGHGKHSAPGQPTVGELRTRYRWAQQTAATPVFGVVGWPVGHSLSPHIHNAGFDALGINGVYVPLAVRPEYAEFAAVVDAMRDCPGMDLRGLSVTIPHKENAMRYVRQHGGEVDELSAHIGVVNTLLWRESLPIGLNSDYAGALDALASAWNGSRASLRDKRIAVIGAGGAARAIVAGLAASGATVVIYNRTFAKAATLAAEFDPDHGSGKVVPAPWEKLSASCCQAYINCTPLGMHPNVNASPLDAMAEPAWNADTVVFNTVYNPLMTRLLKLAKKKGARIITGSEMFVRQAAVQFQEFTRREAPVDVFRSVMLEALKH